MLAYVAYFFGAAFLTNAIPHFVAGTMGEPFQSPFAKPPGKGLSSSMVNVFWGVFNILIGYLLIIRVGNFDLRDNGDVLAAAAGMVSMGVMLSMSFGKFHGGDLLKS